MQLELLDLLKKITLTWLVIDTLAISTVWYLATTIQPVMPYLWKRYICDDAPDYFD